MKHISAAAVVLLCAAAGYSQDNAIKKDSGKLDIPLFLNLKNPPSQGVFDLGDVSKIAPSAELSGVYTSAELGKKEITEGNISSVADALDKVSGVATYKNTRGEQIFTLRGFTEFQVPVMVDGIPIYVPYGDQIDTAKLPLYNVSKITVTKGMSSVLNGPNTMGGAVNIITKKPVKAFEASGDASFAGVSDRDVNVNLGTKMEKFYFTAAGEYADTKGFKLSKDFTPTAVETGGIRSNSDEIRRNFSAKLGFTPSEDHEYAVAANIVSGVFGVPPNASDTRTKYWRFNDWTKNTYYMVGKSRFGGLSLGSKLYYDSYYNVLDAYDNANYNTQRNRSSFHSTYDDHSVGFGVTPTMSFLDGMTTLAGAFSYKDDVHKQQGTAGAAWEKYEAELYSAGAENSWQFQNGLTATAGLSYDIQKPRYSNGGALRAADTAANPQAGLKYEFSDAVQVYGNAGLKSRFPTLKELYSGYMDTKVPNPDLKKEAASNYEIGTRLYSEEAKTAFEASVFYSDIRDLIQTGVTPAGLQQMQNVGKAEMKGFELGSKSMFLPGNETEVSYSYLDARNTTTGAANDYLANRPKHKLYASDLWKITAWLDLFAKASAYSSCYAQDSSGNWHELDGFWTLDASIGVYPIANTKISAGGSNLLDKNYFTDYGNPNPGRVLFVKASVEF